MFLDLPGLAHRRSDQRSKHCNPVQKLQLTVFCKIQLDRDEKICSLFPLDNSTQVDKHPPSKKKVVQALINVFCYLLSRGETPDTSPDRAHGCSVSHVDSSTVFLYLTHSFNCNSQWQYCGSVELDKHKANDVTLVLLKFADKEMRSFSYWKQDNSHLFFQACWLTVESLCAFKTFTDMFPTFVGVKGSVWTLDRISILLERKIRNYLQVWLTGCRKG